MKAVLQSLSVLDGNRCESLYPIITNWVFTLVLGSQVILSDYIGCQIDIS